MARTSVIIPTHNRARLLLRAVESARTAGADVEIVVVDDASSDETPEVCREIADIRYIRLERNVGLGEARNTGIRESSAPYLCFLDDDDLRLAGSIEWQIEALEAEPTAGFAVGKVLLCDQDGITQGRNFPEECAAGDLFWALLERNLFAPNALLVRRTSLDQVGIFDPQFPGLEDWDLWIRLSEHYRAVAVEVPVGLYRCSTPLSGQMTSNPENMIRVGLQLQAKALCSSRYLMATRAQRRSLLMRIKNRRSDSYIFGAQTALSNGKHRQARRYLIRALCTHPIRAARPMTAHLMFQSLFPNFGGVMESRASRK